MPDAEAKLKVTIETAATGSDPQQTAAGLKDVAGAAGQAAAAAQKVAPAMQQAGAGAKEMGQGLGRAVEVGGATTALMQSLGQATQGGAAGFFAIGRSILAFGQIVKGVLLGAGPVGIAVAALGLLAGAALALRDAFKAPRQPIDDLAKSLDELNKKRENNIAEYLDEVSRKAKQARTDLEAVLAVKEAQNDAEEAVALAQVRGDESLTTEQRLRAEQEVKKQAAANRRAAAEVRANQDVIDASRAADAAQNVLEQRDSAAKEAEARKVALEAADPELRRKSLTAVRAAMSPQEVAALQEEADRHGNRASLLYSAASAITSSSETRSARLKEAQDEWAKAQAVRERLDPTLVSDYDPAEAQQKSANLAAAQADAAKKADQLAAAEKALADARDAKTAAETTRNTLLSVTDIKNAAATKIDTMAILAEQKKTADEQAKKTEQTRIEALRRTGYGVASTRFASLDKSVTEADLLAAFPDRAKDIERLGAAITPKTLGQQLAAKSVAEQTAAQQTNTPTGLGVVPAGTALPAWQQSPNAAMQLGGGRLPSDLACTGLPGGITAGPSSSSDAKTAKAIDGATGAMKEMPTGEDTSKSAEELKTATEQAAQAQQAAQAATQAALAATAVVQQQQAGKLGEVVAVCNTLAQQQQQLAGQVAALRLRVANLA